MSPENTKVSFHCYSDPKRHRFDRLVMVLCVRWYMSYQLSYRDRVERMAERGLCMAHTTMMRLGAEVRPDDRAALAQVCPPHRPLEASR